MRREHFLIGIAAIFYGTVVVGGEYFLQSGLSLFETALYPILFMTLCITPIVLLKPQYMIHREKIPFFIVYGFIGAFAEFGQFVGLIFGIPVAIVALVLYTQPLWTIIFSAPLLGEHITILRLTAALLAFAGVAILMLGSWTLQVTHPLSAISATLCASVFISLWVICGRKSGINEQHYVTTTLGWGAFTSVWLVVLWPVLNSLVADASVTRLSVGLPKEYWIYLFLFAIAGGIIPSFCFFRGLRVVDASVAGIILLLEPVSAALLAAIFFSQGLDVSTFAGGALILLSNYLITREPESSKTSAVRST